MEWLIALVGGGGIGRILSSELRLIMEAKAGDKAEGPALSNWLLIGGYVTKRGDVQVEFKMKP